MINDTLIILFYVTRSSPQLQRIWIFVKNTKKLILHQVTGGNTPVLVLKRILGHFLNIPLPKEILEFPD